MKTLLLFISLLVATRLFSAPVFVQGTYSVPPTPQSTVTVQYAAPQIAGDLNVVVVGWNDTTARVSLVTDSNGNVYKLAIRPMIGNRVSQSIYYASNINSGANKVTVVFTSAAAYPDIRILEYNGLSGMIDGTVGATANSATSSSGSLTTKNANDL